MKLAFSSVGCPGWDLPAMVAKAKEFGYDGIELRNLQDRLHLPSAPELAADPAKVAQVMRDAGVQIVCLSTAAAFHMINSREVAENQAQVREYIELAAKLGCPFVRVMGAEIPTGKLLGPVPRSTVLGWIGKAIRELAPFAAEHHVTLLIENSGDFVDSVAMWYLVDVANSPAVKCCWNPLAAKTQNERPTRSIPRLGAKIGMVRVSDGKFTDGGAFERPVLPGQGDVEIRPMIQLLKGIGYRGYLVFDWPKLRDPRLTDPDEAFPAAAQSLRQLIDEKPVPLSAYRGDKFAPRQGYEFVTS